MGLVYFVMRLTANILFRAYVRSSQYPFSSLGCTLVLARLTRTQNQSPSPVDEIDNPYDLTLSRSTSPQRSNKPSSPISTTNNLHRRLSSAQQSTPESPPPAWNRRNSTSSKGNRSPIGTSPLPQPPVDQAPINAAPPSRRHPNLSMTTTRPLIPGQTLTEDSPSGSMTSFEDPTLPLPQAPFRRRPGSTSNRSSFPGLDLSTLTSEELWTLEQEGVLPDMSNPTRHAAERPLDTVRRISMRMEHSQFFHNGLPGDVICELLTC